MNKEGEDNATPHKAGELDKGDTDNMVDKSITCRNASYSGTRGRP